MFKNLIPKIFYDRLQDGLEFFVDGLGFEVLYRDAEMAVVARNGAKAYLVQSPGYAAKDRPELGIDTDDVDAIFEEVSARASSAAFQLEQSFAQALGGARVRHAGQDQGVRELSSVAGWNLRGVG